MRGTFAHGASVLVRPFVSVAPSSFLGSIENHGRCDAASIGELVQGVLRILKDRSKECERATSLNLKDSSANGVERNPYEVDHVRRYDQLRAFNDHARQSGMVDQVEGTLGDHGVGRSCSRAVPRPRATYP